MTFTALGALAVAVAVAGVLWLNPGAARRSTESVVPGTQSGAWPGLANTGVPAGTTLIAHPGDLRTVRDGQIIDSIEVRGGGIIIANNNVTIRRSRITASPTSITPVGIRVLSGHTGIVIQDTEIDMASRPGSVAIGYSGFTVQRCNIHGATIGIQIADHVNVIDTWIHAISQGGTSGAEDVGILGSSSPVASVIRHNTLQNPHQPAAVILIRTDLGLISGVVIDDNYLDGGSYTVYSLIGAFDHRTPPTNVTITSNVFTRNFVIGAIQTAGSQTTIGANAFTDGTAIR